MTYTVDIRKAILIDEVALASFDCDYVHLGRIDEGGLVEVDIHMNQPNHDKMLALTQYLSSITY